MARAIAFPNARGERDIPAVLEEAKHGFAPTRTNRTPSAIARINALISYLWANNNNGEQISESKKRFVRLQFRSLTRQCRLNMMQDNVDSTSWSQLSSRQQLYYSLKLEGAITDFGYPIYRCKRQWCASLLISDAMKGERQTASRRVHVSLSLKEKRRLFFFINIDCFFILYIKRD